MTLRLALLALLPLAACAPAVVAPPPPVPVAVVAPAPVVVPVAGISGLQERQPDLCKAKDYTAALGRPGATVPMMGITRKYRIVEYRGIEPQEYDPARVVFRLDAAGNVVNIDCG